LAMDPGNAEFACNLGDALMGVRCNDAALEQYWKTIVLDPSVARAWLNAAKIVDARGGKEAALELAREGLAAHPADSEAHWLVGAFLYEQGMLEEALERFDDAVRLLPARLAVVASVDNFRGWARRAHIQTLVALRRTEDAAREALAID